LRGGEVSEQRRGWLPYWGFCSKNVRTSSKKHRHCRVRPFWGAGGNDKKDSKGSREASVSEAERRRTRASAAPGAAQETNPLLSARI
ncbi:hypothetical protein C4546_02615, partial [Candidatus Parcubacteria bacterium]